MEHHKKDKGVLHAHVRTRERETERERERERNISYPPPRFVHTYHANSMIPNLKYAL